MSASIGDVLADRYELVDVIGRGGMATVYRARDRVLERTVAVKVLSSEADAVADTNRFLREARAAAGLNHPRIVAVHDAVQAGDVRAIVMELVEGPTLADVLEQRGPLSLEEATEIVEQAAAGLDAAHARGLVHRDIKPSNLLMTDNGVKITDFGIAHAMDQTQAMTTTIRGSAPYLAPEQARGRPTDPRTDVYALGCVLYEMLTGSPPFLGETPMATALQHVEAEPPRPSLARAGLPDRIDRVTLAALAKDPEQRIATPSAFAEALRSVVDGAPAAVTTQLMDRAPTAVMTSAYEPPEAPASAPPPSRGRTVERTSRTPRQSDPTARRIFVFLLAGAVILLLVLFLSQLDFSSTPAESVSEPPASEPVSEEPTEESPAPAPPPEPEPEPEPTSEPPASQPASDGASVQAAAQDVRDTVDAAEEDGEVTGKVADDLRKGVDKVVEASDDGDPDKANDELDKVRDTLDKAVEDGDASESAANAIRDDLDALEDAVDERGDG